MTRDKLLALAKDLEMLHGKHTAHPAVILVQAEGEREIYVLMVGSPSREWLCHVLDDQIYHFSGEQPLMATMNAAIAKTQKKPHALPPRHRRN